ncbi:MAG: MFS transporter [Pseudonocardiales bacterium]
MPGAVRVRAFRRLWLAQSASLTGTAVTYLALPLTAVITLRAAPWQMGLLVAAERLPTLLFALHAGTVVDRMPGPALMIGCDLLRAAALVSLPIAAAFSVLTLAQLYLVVVVLGTASLLFDVTHQTFVPAVVPADRLADANGKLAASQSGAEVAGPGLAGILVNWLSAPGALLADCLSYLISATALVRLRGIAMVQRSRSESFGRHALVGGLRYVIDHPVLRPVVLSTAVVAFFAQAQEAVYILYVYRDLGISAGLLGVIFCASGAFGLLAALATARITQRTGVGRLILRAQLTKAAGGLLLGLATTPLVLGIPLLLLGEACFAAGLAVYGATALTLRQTLAPPELAGRINASVRLLTLGCLPIAGLCGGLLAQVIGAHATMLLAAAGMFLGCLPLTRSAVRNYRAREPAPAPEFSPRGLAV